jgi:hypothetical protein
MKQTAVGLLIQNIVEDQTIKAKSMSEWVMVFEKAKEMEKQQIEDAFCDGVDDEYEHHISNTLRKNSEQYYNETFK